MTFILADSSRQTVAVAAGTTLLEVARAQGLDMEGACDGCMACSTCHVIVAPEFFDRLPEPTEEEDDMLDLAWGVTETSRLGCQVKVTEAVDGLVVRLPAQTHNLLEG